MNRYVDRAAELISDIIYNSTFPIKEIEKEKKVVIDEIHAYEDMPYEQIFSPLSFRSWVSIGTTSGRSGMTD